MCVICVGHCIFPKLRERFIPFYLSVLKHIHVTVGFTIGLEHSTLPGLISDLLLAAPIFMFIIDFRR